MADAIITVISAVGGAAIALMAAMWKHLSASAQERTRELTQIRRRYLEPLRLAAADVREHLEHIRRAFDERDEREIKFLRESFAHVKDGDRSDQLKFAYWCNGVGYFAVATLYRTAVYCWAADRIKRELLFVEPEQPGDDRLLSALAAVREALGGTHGIWQTLQDSIGGYVGTTAGTPMSYREFCLRLADGGEMVWLLRLVDFYNDLGRADHREVVGRGIVQLDQLIAFLGTSVAPAVGFRARFLRRRGAAWAFPAAHRSSA